MQWMRRRWRVWAGALVLLAAISAGFFALAPNRVTRENYARLHKGMSREDVEAILGKEAEHVDQDERYEFERCAHATWFGIDGAAIRVWFNADGKVNRFE